MKKPYNILVTLLILGGCQILLLAKIKEDHKVETYDLQVTMGEVTKKNEELLVSNKELKLELDTINEHNLVLTQEIEEGGFKTKANFNSNNVCDPSNITYEQLKYALKDTKLHPYTETFLEVEEKYSINTLFMVGIVANESAWLNSGRTLNRNNVTGYAVYSDESQGKDFNSIEECILETARLLNEDYINSEGKHYNGLSVLDINKKYSADKNWNSIVISIATDMKNKINEFQEYLY